MPARHPLDHPHIDALWTDVAASAGFRVVRADDAYASVDGRGTMTIGTPQTLDADDCLAVLVLHELCHGFVQGLHRWTESDFGLDNTTDDDRSNEYAALRVQAALADRFALRPLFFSTTVWRPYYEALPVDPISMASSGYPTEPAVLALTGPAWTVARLPRFARAIDRAMARTGAFARAEGVFGPNPVEHPLGGALAGSQTCGACAWRGPVSGRPAIGQGVLGQGVIGQGVIGQCVRRAKDGQAGPRVMPEFPACTAFEAELHCQQCGACCREAYHSVPVGAGDAFRGTHPELVVRDGRRFAIRRAGPRCAALTGSGPYSCEVYGDRPRTCRDFTAGSENCRIARQRVGLLQPVITGC